MTEAITLTSDKSDPEVVYGVEAKAGSPAAASPVLSRGGSA
jgi:hypothetical protein